MTSLAPVCLYPRMLRRKTVRRRAREQVLSDAGPANRSGTGFRLNFVCPIWSGPASRGLKNGELPGRALNFSKHSKVPNVV